MASDDPQLPKHVLLDPKIYSAEPNFRIEFLGNIPQIGERSSVHLNLTFSQFWIRFLVDSGN